ncbi:MAG TPA: hypothetical protein VH137_04820, partial [Gemmatimonadales bacterium]|nr:hypothetical protein [Gemmatimonadales bacterium]
MSVSRCAIVGLMAAVACRYDARIAPDAATAPRTPQLAAMAASAGTLAATGRHIVSFSGSVPSDFTAQVAALGGTVLWISGGSGLAAVSGLTPSGVTALAGNRAIQAVDEDVIISLDVPAIATDDAPGAGGVESNAAPAAAVRYPRQWNMRAVQADVAWAHGVLGSPSVAIYMLDSGIDYLHRDLIGRVDLNKSVDLTGKFNTQLQNGTIVQFSEADTVRK